MTTLSKAPWNKGRKLPVEILTRDDIDALMKRCSGRAPTGIRNKALLVVLWRAGLRISEALALMPKDIDTVSGTVRVLHGKGDKARVVALDPQSLGCLQRWLDKRTELGINGRNRIFCTLQGGPVSTAYVRGLMKRLTRKAGLEKRISPHSLRHTFASECRSENIEIGTISASLGHSNIQTTVRYLCKINPTQVIDTMKARSW